MAASRDLRMFLYLLVLLQFVIVRLQIGALDSGRPAEVRPLTRCSQLRCSRGPASAAASGPLVRALHLQMRASKAISACAEGLQWRWAVGLYAEGERRGPVGKYAVSLSIQSVACEGLGLTLPAASAAVSAAGRARSWKVRQGVISVRVLSWGLLPQPCRWPSTSRTTCKALYGRSPPKPSVF